MVDVVRWVATSDRTPSDHSHGGCRPMGNGLRQHTVADVDRLTVPAERADRCASRTGRTVPRLRF